MSAKATGGTGADLREQRLAVGLSQQRLAELARCSINAVRLFERGYDPARSPVRERVVAVLTGPTTSEGPAGNGTSAKLAVMGDGHGTG